MCEVLESYEKQSIRKGSKRSQSKYSEQTEVTSPHRVYLAKIQFSVDKMEFEMVVTGTQKELRMPQVEKCGHHQTEADLGE